MHPVKKSIFEKLRLGFVHFCLFQYRWIRIRIPNADLVPNPEEPDPGRIKIWIRDRTRINNKERAYRYKGTNKGTPQKECAIK
jgi:hypothetical protein